MGAVGSFAEAIALLDIALSRGSDGGSFAGWDGEYKRDLLARVLASRYECTKQLSDVDREIALLAILIAQPNVVPIDSHHQWYQDRLASALYRRFTVTRSAGDLQAALAQHRLRYVAYKHIRFFEPVTQEQCRRVAALRFARFGDSADIRDLVVAMVLLRFACGQMTPWADDHVPVSVSRSLVWAHGHVVERLCAEVAKLPDPSPALATADSGTW